jgi:deoxyribose-phosphate aldolase
VTPGPLAFVARRDLASLIEHTALKAETTAAAIIRLCAEAVAFGFRGVCVNPVFVAAVRREIADAPVRVVSVVGFPLGASLTATKAQETRAVIEAGADEVDMVLPIGLLKGGDRAAVHDDIAAVVAAAGGKPVKVILETPLLDDLEKVLACQLAERAGAAFVKTSTGFGGARATVEDVALLKRTVDGRLRVKASGGIRDLATARALIDAGADVLGCSASVAIVAEAGVTAGPRRATD